MPRVNVKNRIENLKSEILAWEKKGPYIAKKFIGLCKKLATILPTHPDRNLQFGESLEDVLLDKFTPKEIEKLLDFWEENKLLMENATDLSDWRHLSPSIGKNSKKENLFVFAHRFGKENYPFDDSWANFGSNMNKEVWKMLMRAIILSNQSPSGNH